MSTPMSDGPHAPIRSEPSAPLYKQRSWGPDAFRDEAWLRRKGNWKNRRSKSVTDDDVDKLKACIELGFGFGSSREVDESDNHRHHQRLSDTLPALELYYVVNENYIKSTITTTTTPSSDSDTPSPLGSPHTSIYVPGDNPQTVKSRLRQWAQVVACAVRQSRS